VSGCRQISQIRVVIFLDKQQQRFEVVGEPRRGLFIGDFVKGLTKEPNNNENADESLIIPQEPPQLLQNGTCGEVTSPSICFCNGDEENSRFQGQVQQETYWTDSGEQVIVIGEHSQLLPNDAQLQIGCVRLLFIMAF